MHSLGMSVRFYSGVRCGVSMRGILSYIVLIIFLASCATFIEEEEINQLKIYEKDIYVLYEDVKVDKFSLKKGEDIRLYIKVEEESIKVYGYSSDKSFLKAERVLLLYLFNDDFKDSRFDKGIFEKKLYSIVKQKR
jgi:type II secretion system-associated lipoprotein